MAKYETSKKAKKAVDEMSLRILNSMGMGIARSSKVASSPDEAKARYERQQIKKEDAATVKANNMYEKLISQGKVTPANRNKIKKQIAAKTGVYVTTDAD